MGECNYNSVAGSFHRKKLCSRLYLFDWNWTLFKNNKKSLFEPPCEGLRGNVRISL